MIRRGAARHLLVALLAVLAPAALPGARAGVPESPPDGGARSPEPEAIGHPLSRSGAGDWLPLLRGGSDLVFSGRSVSWSMAPGSRQEARVRCRVDRVWMGFTSDSVVEVQRVLAPEFGPGGLAAGTPVLVRLARRCEPDGGSCGEIYVLAGDTLLADHPGEDQIQAWRERPDALELGDLRLERLADDGLRQLLKSAGGVAVATLETGGMLPSAGGTFRCVNATWVVPGSGDLPESVEFPAVEQCFSEVAPARYLIPVPRGFGGRRLTLDCCPRMLMVKDSVSVGLGLALRDLPAVLARAADGTLRVIEPPWSAALRVR